jgi:hypothetical protein
VKQLDSEHWLIAQQAIEESNLVALQEVLAQVDGPTLSETQLFSDYSLLMYACRHSTPEVVQALLNLGLEPCELDWSDNNELKCALRNPQHSQAITQMILDWLPQELAVDMITTDWNPGGELEGDHLSALEVAQRECPICLSMLQARLRG